MAGELRDVFVMLLLWLLVNVTVQACDPPCLYFTAGRVIKSIELSSKKISSNVTEPQAHGGRVLAVAVDVEEKTLYFSDQVSRTIERIDLKLSKTEDVASEVGSCEDIAIDWVNKYIYWTDNNNGRIEMSRVNGSDRKVLFDRDVQNPRGITVDPVHGYMFWTDYGDNPKIERATLAGQERTTVIANTTVTRLQYPNDVLVDYTSNRIYWVDAGLDVIGTADLEGHNIKISDPIKNSHLFAVALYNNTLYITNSKMNAKSIIVIDKESLREISRFTSLMIGSRDLLGLTMLHESRQPPVISQCSHGNGGCSHLCFIVPDGYRCGCPNGTALREDRVSCQEANFTNCRSLPCQNGGTCYFNFHSFTDACNCSEYYAEKDCSLYLGLGAVRITLEMKVKEFEEEKFKQAISRGLNDYCMGAGDCSSRLNKTIFTQFCGTFLNGSALDASQVTIIGKLTASPLSRTNVVFAVTLRPVSSLKPVVVVNTTLEHIVLETAYSISKHLGGYEIVFVNSLRPVPCNNEEDPKNSALVIIVGITSSLAIVILVLVFIAAVCWFRRRRGNEQREVHVYYEIEGNVLENGQGVAMGRHYEDMETGRIGGEGTGQNQPERRRSQRSVEEYEHMRGGGINDKNEMHAPELSHAKKNNKHFNVMRALFKKQLSGGMENKNTVDNRRRGNNHENVNKLSRENVVNEEIKIVQKNGNQKLEGSYENMSASQYQETSDGTQDAQRQAATPHDVDRRDNQMSMSGGLETRRQAVENDYYSDQEENLH